MCRLSQSWQEFLRASCAGPRPRKPKKSKRFSPMKGKRILITGGAGLVGSHLADLAARERAKSIVVLDNFTRGRETNVIQATAAFPLEIVDGDSRGRDHV